MTKQDKTKLLQVFGERCRKALKVLEEGKVRKFIFSPSERIVWTVVGKDREYQILSLANFCSCNDFYFRVLNYETYLCYHLMAQKMAVALEKYIVIKKKDEEYETLMTVLRQQNREHRKLPIAEVENIRKTAETILLNNDGVSTKDLLLEIQALGFEVLTSQHLAVILNADKKKRFKCHKGKWFSRVRYQEKS